MEKVTYIIKDDPTKESPGSRKERVATSGSVYKTRKTEDRGKGRTSYKRHPKHKGAGIYTEGTIMEKHEKFINFLEGLKGHGQDSLIESVKKGFQACYEALHKCPKCLQADSTKKDELCGNCKDEQNP